MNYPDMSQNEIVTALYSFSLFKLKIFERAFCFWNYVLPSNILSYLHVIYSMHSLHAFKYCRLEWKMNRYF